MNRRAGLLGERSKLVGLAGGDRDGEPVPGEQPRQRGAEARARCRRSAQSGIWAFPSGSPRCSGIRRRYRLNCVDRKGHSPWTRSQPAGRIDVISDVICPWCYIGKRQLERALDLLEKQHKLRFTVAWHPFQLNPDMPARGRRPRPVPHRQVRQRSSARSQMDERITETAADGRPRIPSRQADPHAQHAERPSPDPASPARRACRTASSRRCSKATSATAPTSATTRCWPSSAIAGGLDYDDGAGACWRATRASREVLAGDQMARNCGIQGVPSFALQGHVLFSGAVPAEEMAQAFRQRLGPPEEPRGLGLSSPVVRGRWPEGRRGKRRSRGAAFQIIFFEAVSAILPALPRGGGK